METIHAYKLIFFKYLPSTSVIWILVHSKLFVVPLDFELTRIWKQTLSVSKQTILEIRHLIIKLHGGGKTIRTIGNCLWKPFHLDVRNKNEAKRWGPELHKIAFYQDDNPKHVFYVPEMWLIYNCSKFRSYQIRRLLNTFEKNWHENWRNQVLKSETIIPCARYPNAYMQW